MTQRVAITGASGLIGGALSSYLTARGDDVLHLVRRPARTAAEVTWDPARRSLRAGALDGVDAVVHLAGANVGAKRWTASYKQQILASRVDSTTTIAAALVKLGQGTRLVSGSAVGYYGGRDDDLLTESSSPGTGFLAEVVQAWERAAAPGRDAGLPVAFARTGIVLSPHDGAMAPLLKLGRLGLVGPLGSGRQFWPWITLADEVRALAHLVDNPEMVGPVNLVAPEPARQQGIASEIGRRLHRPALLPAPAPGLHVALGELASDILASQRVVPARLLESGFVFDQPTLPEAISWLLAQR